MVFGNLDCSHARCGTFSAFSTEVLEISYDDIILVNEPILTTKGYLEYRKVFRNDNGVPTLPMKMYTRITREDGSTEIKNQKILFLTLFDPGKVHEEKRGSKDRVIVLRRSDGSIIHSSILTINMIFDMYINKKQSKINMNTMDGYKYDLSYLGTNDGITHRMIKTMIMEVIGYVMPINRITYRIVHRSDMYDPIGFRQINSIDIFTNIVESYMLMLCRNDFINHKSQFDPINVYYDNAISRYKDSYLNLNTITADKNSYLYKVYPDEYVVDMYNSDNNIENLPPMVGNLHE